MRIEGPAKPIITRPPKRTVTKPLDPFVVEDTPVGLKSTPKKSEKYLGKRVDISA